MTHISKIRSIITPPKSPVLCKVALLKRSEESAKSPILSSDFKQVVDRIVEKGLPDINQKTHKALYLFLKDAFMFLQNSPKLKSEEDVDKYKASANQIISALKMLGHDGGAEEVVKIFNSISQKIDEKGKKSEKGKLTTEQASIFLKNLESAIEDRATYIIVMHKQSPNRKVFIRDYKITRTEAVLNKLKAIDPKSPKIIKTISLLDTRLDKLNLLEPKDMESLSMGKKKESKFKSFFAMIFRFMKSINNNKNQLKNDLKAHFKDSNSTYKLPLSDNHLLEEVFLQTVLKETFKDNPEFKDTNVKEYFNSLTTAHMNEKGAWSSFSTHTEFFTDSGHELSFESSFISSKDILEEQKHGYSSMDRTTDHLSNAWASEFDTGVPALNPKHIRMATLSAFGVNKKFAKELLIEHKTPEAVADQYPEITGKNRTNLINLLNAKKFNNAATMIRKIHNQRRANELKDMIATSFKTKINKLEDTATVHVVNVNVMTPDDIRALIARGKPAAGNEKLMTHEQREAFKDFDGSKIHDRPIKSLNFTFGVNQGGFSKLSIINGTRAVKQHNKESMKVLLGTDIKTNPQQGLVGDYLTQLNKEIENAASPLKQQLELKKAMIEKLATQVGQIWTNGSFLKSDNEPYKMVSRLTLLTDLLDSTVTTMNCKSGKDRTSQLDAEVKYLTAKFIKDGDLPEVNAKKLPEDIRLMRNIILTSGNYEIQEMNTGARGYKLKGVPALVKQMGGDKKTYHGLSGFVKS